MPKTPKRSSKAVAADEGAALRILAAADELLGEHGYDGVSINDVAVRAGVNKALVFYYFESKAALFEKVLGRYYEAHAAALAEGLAPSGSPRERLQGLVDRYLDFIDENRRYPRLVQQEVARGAGNLGKIRENLAAFLGWTAKALEGVVPAKGPLAAKHFFLSISGMVINYYTYGPVLAGAWGEDPMSEHARAERRKHLRFVVDALLDRLLRDGGKER